ncbi:MAG TPA: 30S ribosomal protein S8 [Bacteroidetes bacterium]|nr:30S ribosomal protein S8 [Bacteroidota bacterium]
MTTDPISDYLTRIRNGQNAHHRIVEIPASNLKKSITEILYKQGYILKYKFDDSKGPQGTIMIALKYHPETKLPAIRNMRRMSRPGLRSYAGTKELPRTLNGLGTVVISTPKGLMTEKEARANNVGGEVLFSIS